MFSCKQYITELGQTRVWDIPPQLLLQRLEACHRLYKEYQECFHQSKQKVSAERKAFEISELYVFGKFASFCRRLDEIRELVTITQQFSVLKESHIEGIEALANAFGHMFLALRKKPYNPLDHRKMEFSVDFAEFCRQVNEMEGQLCAFMASSFAQVESLAQFLHLLKRFVKYRIMIAIIIDCKDVWMYGCMDGWMYGHMDVCVQ